MNSAKIATETTRIANIPTREDRVAALDELMTTDRTTWVHVSVNLRNAGLLAIDDTWGWRRWFELHPTCPRPDDMIPTNRK